jgi:hypothetical protein
VKRILLVLTVALVLIAMVVATAAPGFANPRGANHCNHQANPLCGGNSPGGNPHHP